MVPSINDDDVKGSDDGDTGDDSDGDGDTECMEALHGKDAWAATDADTVNPWPMESAH